MEKEHVLLQFQTLPGVGESIAEDLWNIGFRSPSELQNKNPEKLYEQLNNPYGKHIDRCMLYVFRCIVYFVSHKKHDPEKLKWWNWSDERLRIKKHESRIKEIPTKNP